MSCNVDVRTYVIITLPISSIAQQVATDEKRILGLGMESVLWIDDVPIRPVDLVGRVYYLQDQKPAPFFLGIDLKAELIDEPSVSESIAKQEGTDGNVSFGGFV